MKLTHKCPARAILRRTVESDENGEEVVLNELLEIATPEVSWILGGGWKVGGSVTLWRI